MDNHNNNNNENNYQANNNGRSNVDWSFIDHLGSVLYSFLGGVTGAGAVVCSVLIWLNPLSGGKVVLSLMRAGDVSEWFLYSGSTMFWFISVITRLRPDPDKTEKYSSIAAITIGILLLVFTLVFPYFYAGIPVLSYLFRWLLSVIGGVFAALIMLFISYLIGGYPL